MNPSPTPTSRGETEEEYLAKTENVLRLIENAVEHAIGAARANLSRTAGETAQRIRRAAKADLAGGTEWCA